MKVYNLSRYIIVHNYNYETVLLGIRVSSKCNHRIWYIFPQFKEFAHSHIAEYYGIEDKCEAENYLQHPILGQRIREIAEALQQQWGKDVKDIFGDLNAGIVIHV